MKTNNLLFIEPSDNRTMEPIMDSLTRKMTASLRKSDAGIEVDGVWTDKKDGGGYFGYHKDACGCISDSSNHRLSNGRITNNLCVHYVAFHRWEIPLAQLEEIASLEDGEEEPTTLELWPK